MKKILFLISSFVLVSFACNNSNQEGSAKLDSIQEAAAADSMLNSALLADSLMQDSIKKDTISN